MRLIKFALLAATTIFLQSCSQEAGEKLTLDGSESAGYLVVKIYFHTSRANLQEEKNVFMCISGDGKPVRFYQGRENGIEASGPIELIRSNEVDHFYSSNLITSYYDKKNNSWNDSDHAQIHRILDGAGKLSCRVVSRNYYRAPDLSQMIQIDNAEFRKYYRE